MYITYNSINTNVGRNIKLKMVTLQFIGLITLMYLAYKYMYLPYLDRKKIKNEEIEIKIGILSDFQKEMMRF